MILSLEQLEADPPRLLKLRQEDDASVFEVTYRLAADENGTRFTQISEFEWKTLPHVLHTAVARGVRRDVQRQLRDLKRARSAISSGHLTIASKQEARYTEESGKLFELRRALKLLAT